MTSTIISLVIDNFLSNFIEIDKSQTNASLLSGTLELRNVKIKKESFSYIKLPYFILDIGYIGKIKIEMSMPFFYSNEINIFINDIFIFAKQKDINNLNEKEEITSLKNFKNNLLEAEENIHNKLSEIENAEPSMFSQILKNININIKNIVIRFEDNILNPNNPFALGILLKEINIKNLKENNNSDFCYKSIKITDLDIFMDISNSFEELNYDKLIDEKNKDMVSLDMTKYLGNMFNFYVYCLTELNSNLKHDFILYKLSTELKFTFNFNLENNNPKYELYSNEIEKFEIKLNLGQISKLFLLLSYYNLFHFFQLGLSKKIFNKNFSEQEKEKYIIEYIKYYYHKYKEKKDEKNNALKTLEENAPYEEIKYLRKIGLNYIYKLFCEEKEIEEKLKNENNKWFFSTDKNLIKEYNDKLTNIKNQISEKIKYYLLDKYSILFNDKDIINDVDLYWNLPDDFLFYIAKLSIKELSFKICDIDDEEKNIDLLDLNVNDMMITYIAKKYNASYSLSVKNIVLNQNIAKNDEYDKLLIAKSEKKEEFIFIEYQTNKDEFGNFINKIIFKSGIQIIFFINLYQLQYINYNILSCLYSFISFIEIPRYTDDNFSDHIQLGYIINENNKLNKKKIQQENFSVKYDYDINLKNPILIIPQDILNPDNKKCIIISAEDIILKSNLSNEANQKDSVISIVSHENIVNESNSNYESCLNDSSIMDNIYDKHFLNINGIQIFLSNYCTKEDNYKTFDNILVNYFNLSILYKTLVDLSDKTGNYNMSSFTLDIKEISFSVDEFQILFLLTYLKKIKKQNEFLIENKVINLDNNDEYTKKYNDEKIYEFIEKSELKGIISKNEFFLVQKNIINKESEKPKPKNGNEIIGEDEFYKKQNKFLMEVKISSIKFILYKIYPSKRDLTKEVFLQLELTNIIFSKFTSYSENSLMKLSLKDISLLNPEKDENKNFLLPKEFQLLIKNDEENINCINYSNLYKKNLNEYVTNIEINNLDILSSFDSLTRIYTFAMYYFGKYQDIYYDYGNKNMKKFMNFRKTENLKERNSKLSKEQENTVKIYKISNQNIFKFKLKNSFLRIPSDETNTDKPIFSMKLNIFYDQSSNRENENIYDANNKTLMEGKLLYDNKTMNIMIYESNFDIIYFNEKGIRNDKIISNFRIQYNSKYSYLLSKKNSISNMNIIVEPLILNVNLHQLKYLINFYFDLMKFLFESLYSNYVPLLKFEDVIYVKGVPKLVKRRKSIKLLVSHVVELNKMKNKIVKISKQKKKKSDENITNSFNSLNLQLDKIYVTILDDNYSIKNKKEKRVLLALEMSKIFFNKINNSNPRDKTNISNDLFSIIANTPVSIDKYVVHNLYKYMNCTFTLELYHYNLEYSDFEPFIEPFNVQYLSFQTNPIFRAKTYINIENIININVSTNSMKILNIFMSKYSKENPSINGIDNSNIIMGKKKSEDFLRMISKENNNIEEQEETVIKLINKTGLLINFWFDFDKENKIKIKNNDIVHLTNKQIYKTRKRRKLIQKKESERNTFSFQILNYESIKKINLNSSDNLYFKTKINDDGVYLYYNLKINTNSFIKEIIFESSMVFLNESKFDDLILSINDQYIENDKIILTKNKKVTIPLTWVISSKNIFLQINHNSEKFFVYDNISEIIQSNELTMKEIKEKQKQVENIKNSLENKLNNYDKINLHHPKYKNYISTYILQRFNKKNSKLVSIKNENNEDIYLYFDYCSMSYKYYHNNSEKLFHFLEYTKKSNEFIILIRPIANITNYTPFDITCYNNKDNSKIEIAKRQTIELYNDKWLNSEFLIKLNLLYNNDNYETDFMNINSNKNYINTLTFSNESKEILHCNISHNILNKSLNIFDNELENYSFLSYNYILFFDFIINNRIEFDLYGIDPRDIKNKSNKDIYKFNSEILSVFSSNKGDIQNLLINSTSANFNSDIKVNVNAVDLENVIEIEYEKNIYNILCKASNSVNYIYSNILLFEPKYILINDLDFDIYIQQINEENKPIDKIQKIIAKKYIPLYYKTQKKIIYKIGIKLSKDNPLISLSGEFELDNAMEYELKVEVDESYFYKYPKNVFNIGDKVFLYFRIKDKITDEGNVYLFITFPDYPILEIDNRTNELIKIYETKKEDEPVLINPTSKIPFIWSNNVVLKNKFFCQILNKKIVLSFSQYNQTVIKIDKNKFIIISNYQKNSLTGTRCITFEEKKKEELNDEKNEKREFFALKNKLKSLNRVNIFIKGIGLSFLDEAPKEIFYISFYELRLTYTNLFISLLKTTSEIFEFHLKNFQIDSSLNNTIKTLIYPKKQNIPSLESDNTDTINFISLSIVKNSNINIAQEIKNIKYPKIDLCIQEIYVKIDQSIVMNLISLITNYTSKLLFLQTSTDISLDKIDEEEKLLSAIKIPTEELKKEAKNSNKILVNRILLSAMKINLSFKLDISSINISYMPKFISRLIGSLGGSLVSISDSPLSFNEVVIDDVYLRMNDITDKILKSYRNQTLFQIYKILGSSDLIGNPVQLIEKIGTGFFEFVNEPRKGLLKGPSQFGKGLAKGFAGLLNGIIGGAFDSVSKISGTLYNLVQNITGNNKDLIVDEEDEPSNIISGASQGIIDGMLELYDGFTGLVINPIEKATDESNFNVVKLFKDLGKGLFRFAVSPVNFILRIGNSISVGTKNTFNYFYIKSVKNQRFRFPRYIKPNTLLTIYDPDLSAAKEFLYKIHKLEEPNIIFVSQFYCENKRYNGKIAYFILTNEIVILLSNKYEEILNMNVLDINEVELKYNGKYFEFVCRLKEENYKIILINKKNNAFACELFCVLENVISLRNGINTTANKIPYIKRFKNGLKENIRKKKIKEENDDNISDEN